MAIAYANPWSLILKRDKFSHPAAIKDMDGMAVDFSDVSVIRGLSSSDRGSDLSG